MRNRKVSYEAKCLPPCLKMKINIEKSVERSNIPKNSIFDLTGNDIVEVNTESYAYDIFNLVVDLGSALGLWLGLSALSIMDFVVFHLKND